MDSKEAIDAESGVGPWIRRSSEISLVGFQASLCETTGVSSNNDAGGKGSGI
jgi:hypothetical protein